MSPHVSALASLGWCLGRNLDIIVTDPSELGRRSSVAVTLEAGSREGSREQNDLYIG